ncbi:peptidoglycan editing factor PgeF [Rheinheimera marina]|uniref:Purine nucleoside phosphorylase n=1 Tax=Rheinheimera marina TaxID=1774958 RepID=A0ABV9JLU7_9GAMM
MTALLLKADWPAPAGIHTAVSTRLGGVSAAPYASLNLGSHVADQPACVMQNRERFRQLAALPAEPCWLNQTHSTLCVDIETTDFSASPPNADAAFTRIPGQVATVLTADCLPVLFCNSAGTAVAAAHAGWRGLCDGVLEQTLARFSPNDELLVWLGPAIGPSAFEVGDDVRTAFIARQSAAEHAFIAVAGKPGKWLADLYLLARLRLQATGVSQIYGGGLCTYTDQRRFYSYRRDGQTGRMASCIWLD